jgi:hypothetical protein
MDTSMEVRSTSDINSVLNFVGLVQCVLLLLVVKFQLKNLPSNTGDGLQEEQTEGFHSLMVYIAFMTALLLFRILVNIETALTPSASNYFLVGESFYLRV